MSRVRLAVSRLRSLRVGFVSRASRVAAVVIFFGAFVTGAVYLVQGLRSATSVLDRLKSDPPAQESRSLDSFTELGPGRAESAGLLVTAEVQRKDGRGEWAKEARAIPGDVVQWRLRTENAGSAFLLDVVTRVVLGPHLELVPDSARFINVKGETSLRDGPLFGGGYNAGRYVPGDATYDVFDTRALADFSGCANRTRSVALVRARDVPERKGTRPSNSADVIVGKTRC